MTPYLTRLAIRAQTEKRTFDRKLGIFIAWHAAAFERQKKLPDLQRLLRTSKKDMGKDLKNALMGVG